MKEIDDTPLHENESERPEWFEEWLITTQMAIIKHLQSQVNKLKTQVADLEHSRRVGRHPPTDQDPEWYA